MKSFTLLITILFAASLYAEAQPGETRPVENRFPENPSLEFKIGQMLMIGFRGMSIQESGHIERDLNEYHLGSVLLFDYDVPTSRAVRNIESPAQLHSLIKELQAAASTPLFVTVDQEGGRVARLKQSYGFPATVTAQYLGDVNDPDSTRFYSSGMAVALSNAGINVNLAPVVDLNTNPANPVIGGIQRSYSDMPETVTRHAGLFIEAHHRHGVLTVLKHFPGHGSSKDDSHIGLVDVTDTWSPAELIPYRNLVDNRQADMIMTAHVFNENWDEEYPATLSKNVIGGILRDELGFEGPVISDDMQMEAIRSHFGLETAIEMALAAGVDILCFANNSIYDEEIVPKAVDIILSLIDQGRLSEETIDQSYRRIQAMKANL